MQFYLYNFEKDYMHSIFFYVDKVISYFHCNEKGGFS